MSPLYWERHPDGPFVTLIAIAATYLDPENYDPDSLRALAKREDHEEMRVFKSELREALKDPSQLPGDELSESVEYDHGCDEAFLRWLWHELYGDEPFDADVITRLKALPEPFADRLDWVDWRVRFDVGRAARAGEWGTALDVLLAALARSGAPVSPADPGHAGCRLAGPVPAQEGAAGLGRTPPRAGRGPCRGRLMPLSELHRQVAAIALCAAAGHGFALGGGNALIQHEVISRPTQDVDLFYRPGGRGARRGRTRGRDTREA